jgi:protein dithiol oxidoreductase (disulfide-forming)
MMKDIAAILIAGFLVVCGQAAADTQSARTFVAGQHYQVLPVPVRVADPNRLEVVEVFSYGCVHCFNFQPAIDAWLEQADDDVNFVRLPAVFNQDWAYLAKAFYAAEALGVTEQVHAALFQAVHVRNTNILDPARLARIFEEHGGVSQEAFERTFNSMGVDTRVRQADAQTRMFRVSGTPTMVVNGKYRIDGNMAGSNAAMLDVVDFLLQKDRAAASTAQ